MKWIKSLPLKPGLRWRGKLGILFRTDDGKYVVAFDAVEDTKDGKRYVYDHCELTADQLEAWTGWRE